MMDNNLERKLSSLRKKIRKLDSALVAFSGGVDSTFLTRICREELGEKAVAVTSLSTSYPRTELSLARRVAKIVGVKHLVIDPQEHDLSDRTNLETKGSNMYSFLKGLAMRMKLKHVIDGSHLDDANEGGIKFNAARRAKIRSPLLESDLSKAEIRLLAKELGLPNWDKPPSSEKKTKKPKAQVRAATYLKSINKTATLKTSGKTALIVGSKTTVASLAKHLSSIGKKMKSFGFSEVLLKLSK